MLGVSHDEAMARAIETTDFFAEAFHAAQALPLKGFALAAAFGLINLTIDLVFPHFGTGNLAGYVAIGLLTIASLAAYYVLAMIIVEIAPSWIGGLRFGATLLVSLILPLALLFAGLWLMRSSDSVSVVVVGLSLLFLLVGLPLLAGWPVAQAVSNRLVSPLGILRATKGYRWGLFVASYASTAINKILPATDTAKTTGQTILLAIGDGGVSCISLILLASIAATAYKFAIRSDPGLTKGAHQSNA